ncbi:gluconate 5-dehydrogenase [Bombardia bombarda]|uniref:Gluconate 5-dehydrogenase n=1 Tax=Bombardia bombarda TaxID=252184 RepID=A0AA39U5Y6_9PEZI|nr:gluconate 5-dehydrogenase [Bombardia bombarda]
MAQKVDTCQLKAERLFSVDGWACLVTGGGTGIGLMCAQALAANGARVYITGRRMEILESSAATHSPKDGPGKIIPIGPCDVTSKPALASLASSLAAKEPRGLNLLVCNAGISGPKATPSSSDATELRDQLWEKEDPSGWADVFSTNVTGVYFSTLAFLPLLQAATKSSHCDKNNSSVIVISSMSGIMRQAQGHFSYNAAKGATVHLAKLMSTEFGKTGVRVNSIAPGYFPSEMTTGESDDRQKSSLADEVVQGKGHAVPAGRAGSDEEMAQACLFLAKNRYVNGEIVAIDGGVLGQVPGR